MQIYPAIDIEGGRVARGSAGSADPVTEATALRRAGARWLHVVDMDRVFGRGDNTAAIRRITEIAGARVQLGGGCTDPALPRAATGWGVARVIVGTELIVGLAPLARELGPERLGVNLDVRAGLPTDRLGSGTVAGSAEEIVDRVVACGVTTIVYRDLDRDGTLVGADLQGAVRLVGRGAEIILAGGVGSVDEIARARQLGLGGVIVGRALHECRFTLAEALACSA